MPTPSNMLPLGTTAPAFALTDAVSGRRLGLPDGALATVVMFLCNHCPYVKHVNAELVHVARDYLPRGAAFIAISSNDVTRYPEDGPEAMKQVAAEEGYPFPYLYDADQRVARAYDAACTPDFYVFDSAQALVYRGRFDGSTPGNGLPVTGAELRAALDAVLTGQTVPGDQRPSLGCSIKWASPMA